MIRRERKTASVATVLNTSMGVGGGTSASIGDNMVATLAPMLQIPKAVPAKIAGKMVELAR